MRAPGPLAGVSILTTDAEKRIGLYAIRYLGRAGASITAVAERDNARTPVGFLSRYVGSKIELPGEDFQRELKRFYAARAREFQLINPIDIAQMLCLIDADREHHLECTYLLPKRESLVIADNKELLTRHAEEAGLRCPRTFTRVEPPDLGQLCNGGLTFPCIIKFRGDNRRTHWRPEERYSVVRNRPELESEYGRMHAIEPYPIIQEYIEGKGFGFFALYDRKRNLKARFCHKRLREYPARGGPSSCCEAVFDPELVRRGRRLLESLEWIGLAMVEFKFDEARKEYTVIEVNPRYWGSLPLAVRSGVNFPVLHALSALEHDYEPVLEYRLGVRVRFFDRDVKAILSLAGMERRLSRKIALLLQIVNPALREGLFTFDDLGPVADRLLRRKRASGSPDADR